MLFRTGSMEKDDRLFEVSKPSIQTRRQDTDPTQLNLRILFNALQTFHTNDETTSFLKLLVNSKGINIVSFLNAHAVNVAANNAQFFDVLLSSEYLFRDGIGSEIGCQLLGISPGLNLNGTDLIPQIIEEYRGLKVGIIGAKPLWSKIAAKKLRSQGHIVAAIDGYQPIETYFEFVTNELPDLLVIGMGMPKQELLAQALKPILLRQGHSCTIVNGGAILDFIAGRVDRAPLWYQRMYIEWVFRLLQEPRRLGKRYLLGNPAFLWRMINHIRMPN